MESVDTRSRELYSGRFSVEQDRNAWLLIENARLIIESVSKSVIMKETYVRTPKSCSHQQRTNKYVDSWACTKISSSMVESME